MLARKAGADEIVLRKLLDDPDVPDEMLGFHAQQAVEKRIKSVLADRGVEFERTHNIAYLLRLLADREIEPPADADRASALTPWATGFRYEDVPEHSLDRPMVRGVVDAVSRWATDMGNREATCE